MLRRILVTALLLSATSAAMAVTNSTPTPIRLPVAAPNARETPPNANGLTTIAFDVSAIPDKTGAPPVGPHKPTAADEARVTVSSSPAATREADTPAGAYGMALATLALIGLMCRRQ